MMNIKILPLLSLFLFAFNLQPVPDNGDELPQWASTYGTNVPYPEETHLTGFGMSKITESEGESLEAAKAQASSDLVRKVRVSIKSKFQSRIKEVGKRASSSYNEVTRTSSQLNLEGLDFKTTKSDQTIYALAYVNLQGAHKRYKRRALKTLNRLNVLWEKANEFEQNDKKNQALETYIELEPLFKTYHRQYTITNILQSESDKAFQVLEEETGNNVDSLIGPKEVIQWEEKNQGRINKLSQMSPSSLSEAFRLIMQRFKLQNLKIRDNKVHSIHYQDSDFSSAFGSYVKSKLAQQMTNALPPGSTSTITRGYYWDLGEELELSVAVTNNNGEELASSQVRVPKSGIPNKLELKPKNFQKALEAEETLDNNATDQNGINVEVFSNKSGSDENSVVLQDGENIKFYFKVNQPSYLRLTYVLANGTKILLWNSFRIGEQKVNTPVMHPKTFVAAPPFGVERMIVTAYTQQPPPLKTVQKNYAGEAYEVIKEKLSDVLVQTRGLKTADKQNENNQIKMGKDEMTITTIPRDDNNAD